jgi:riboflavin kinase / FMN adenylyltransferase
MRMIRLTSEYIDRVLAGDSALHPQDTGPSALALGSFDGLHLGHQALIRAVREAKQRHGLRSCGLFTFRRHPSLVLGGRDRPFLLTTWREKLALLDDAGLDVVVAASFSPALARLDYRRFVREFLVDYLGMRHFVAGYDVHLGAGREGNAQSLAALGREIGYELEVVEPAQVDGRTVSSSAIRAALEAGEMDEAARLLGRPYALWGEVRPGDGRGRTIGYPTANVESLDVHKLLPAPGVYAVRIQVPGDVVGAGGNGCLATVEEGLPEVDRHGDILSSGHARWRIYGGMLNFGRVPTFNTGGLALPRIEVNVFDFAGDLRGRTVKVEWLSRLRDERRFGGVGELVEQLRQDEAAARAVVAAAPLPAR